LVHTYPALPFAKLSLGELEAPVPYSVRIGFRTAMVNGTVVLRDMGLEGSRHPVKLDGKNGFSENSLVARPARACISHFQKWFPIFL
jgi:hypothetical protein